MFKNVEKWIGGYLLGQMTRVGRGTSARPVHVIVAICDHFEPEWKDAGMLTQSCRVDRWLEGFPPLAGRHRDSNGCSPRHTFFYPVEVYQRCHLEKLEKICRQGFGEVEMHLHHRGDTEETLRSRLDLGKRQLANHGFLGRHKLSDTVAFGFIHGNWALNNSHPEGDWCGVNDEIRVLKDAGCYADFTFPSAPDSTQTQQINRLYYADSSWLRPCGHARGTEVMKGRVPDRGLMLIVGPLTLDWRRRVNRVFPRIENGSITGVNPPVPHRVDLWIRQGICVRGREDWVFVKVHTHGAQENNMPTLLGEPMDAMFSYLESAYNDRSRYLLHYVSAREMYNIAKAAEAGESGSPHWYRDYLIGRPGCA